VLLLFSVTSLPARPQFGGGMITAFTPMLEMMKARIGPRRFGIMMQTMGPMLRRLTDSCGCGGATGGFAAPGLGGDDVMEMFGDGGELMSMIPQLMRLANVAGGYRRHRRR
jgi:hypothetical protein